MEQEQKRISTWSRCNSEVGNDPNEHGTETYREKSKVANYGSRSSSFVDEGRSLASKQVENSAKSDQRRRHRHKSSETSHHDQRTDSDSHHDDRDTDRYRDQRSSVDGRKPCYEPRQRRCHSPSVIRDRYRGKGRHRRSRSHTNSYDDSKSWHWLRCSDNDVRDRHRSHEPPKRNTAPDNASPSSVTSKKGVGVYNLPTGVNNILLPQTTSISTVASVASPSTARISVTAETEDADNDTPAPRVQTSVHIDVIKLQE